MVRYWPSNSRTRKLMDQDELMVNGRGQVALWSRSKYPKVGGKISSE